MAEDIAAHVDQQRLWSRHMALAEIGATPAGGVNRQALSGEEIAARRLLTDWARSLELRPSSDAIANLFLRYEGTELDAAPVLTGSHIDSQPTGGKFDGTFGVLAGIEAIAAMRDAGFRPRRPIEIVAWTNEEGSRFAPGMMGSALFRGKRNLDDMLAVTDGAGISVAQSVEAVRAAETDIPLGQIGFPVSAYVEAHIEQGPVLEMEGKVVGIVTGIQGKRVFHVTVTGEENHAGTAPRSHRKDALVATTDMMHCLHAEMHDAEDIVKFTVGKLDVWPNAPSVVPARTHFSIDLRHPNAETLARLGDRIAPICSENKGRCEVEVRELSHDPPLDFPDAMQDVIRESAQRLGIPHMDLPSAAGHDARHLHYVCPTGMIFVPCAGGVSHRETESCTASDLYEGTRVLAETLARLAG
ncbi:MAG: M20 family metallo-hydrolase [Gammaproteobacteria bacterium]